MHQQLIADLQNTANKLRALWGNNPDSQTIEKAVEVLKGIETKAEETPAPRRATAKKD